MLLDIKMKNASKKIDTIIAFAIFIQSLLVVIQQTMIMVLHYESETTTVYRIAITAIAMVIAIIFSVKRKPKLFFITYLIAIVIILLHFEFFPDNQEYISYNITRFLLPVVIPSALCTICIKDITVINKVLKVISWSIVLIMAFYIYSYMKGLVVGNSEYNMSLSYGLLLPGLFLYSNKKIYSIIASIFLFLCILILGARGPMIAFLIFIAYDIVQSNKKMIFPVAILAIIVIGGMSTIMEFFGRLGFQSRTLNMFATGDFSSSSGRDEIYNKMINVMWDHPFGIGIFGDRVYLNGLYCHNIFLEIALNFGLIVFLGILVYSIVKFVKVYKASNKVYRNILVLFLVVGFIPLLISGSYLTDYNLGLFIGILTLIAKQNVSCVKHA